MPDDANSPAPAIEPSTVFQFLRENFAVISGLAIVGGIGLSTIFLAIYLSSFNWHLFWFVQYTDILTFGLIAVGIVGCSLIFLQATAQAIIAAYRIGGASKRWYLIGFALLLLAIVGWNVWDSAHQGEGYFHILFGALALGLGVFFLLLMFLHVRAAKWPNATQVLYVVVVIITCAASISQWLAYSISETSEFDQDVVLKSETITDAKVIIVLSRFTILLKDKMLHVVPTADITQFQTKHPLLLIGPAH